MISLKYKKNSVRKNNLINIFIKEQIVLVNSENEDNKIRLSLSGRRVEYQDHMISTY